MKALILILHPTIKLYNHIATYNHEKIVSIYTVSEISKNYSIRSYPKLENCLLGAVSLSKKADIDKCKYSGYGIGSDRGCKFSFGNRLGRNCIIFGADLSSSSHANNKKIIFLSLVKIVLHMLITKT